MENISLKSNRFLLSTLAGLFLTFSFGVYITVEIFTAKFIEKTQLRSQMVADMVAYAAESVHESSELKRFINALAAEKGVELVAIIHGRDPSVIMSSDNHLTGKSVASLSLGQSELTGLQEAMKNRESHFTFVPDTNTFVIFSPIRLNVQPSRQPNRLLDERAGFETALAFVRIDASFITREALTSALLIVGTFITGLALVGAWTYWFMYRRTQLILNVIDSVRKSHEPIDIQTLRKHLTPEIEQLATALNTTLQELRQSERRLGLALESGKMGATQWNLKEGKLIWSHNTGQGLGLQIVEEEDSFESFIAKVHPADQASMREGIALSRRSGAACDVAFRWTGNDGEHWFAMRGRTFVTETGGEAHMIAIILDIHEQKLVEEQVKGQQVMLVQSAKMSALGEMAGGVAHEINNPLAIIQSKSAQLRRRIAQGKYEIDDFKQGLEKIEETVLRVVKIVKGLRNFARDGEKDAPVDATLAAVINDSLEICQQRLASRRIPLILDGAFETIHLNCVPVQISQVLINLVNNAFDAIETDGHKDPWIKIALLSDPDPGFFQLSVSNSGAPIPESIRNRIMEPFFTTKPVGKGTGLGLSISLGILESHGGSLVLDQAADHPRFIIRLPTASAWESAPKRVANGG